jgi:hypothetical protein
LLLANVGLPISRYPLAKAASTTEVRVAASLSLYVPTVKLSRKL